MKFMYWGFLIFVLGGCATTGTRSGDLQNLQIKVAQLERQLHEKDQKITDLEYDVKDLTLQLEDRDSYPIDEPVDAYRSERLRSAPAAVTQAPSKEGSKEGTIRVPVDEKTVQQALRNAGYYTGAIDGKIGPQSEKAIINFQKDHSLTTDGIIGKNTWDKLQPYLY